MKRRIVRKSITSFLLVMTLLLVQLPGAAEVCAAEADSKEVTGLQTGSIENPTGSGEWNYVYYGKYNENPVKYRVLDKASTDFGGNTMLLDCDSKLFTSKFDTLWSNNWENSSINKDVLNGTEFLNKDGVFTEAEKEAIFKSIKAAKLDGEDGSGCSGMNYAPLTGQQIFLLDAAEATRSSYGYIDWGSDHNGDWADGTREKRGAASWWWLRSPYTGNDNYAGCVNIKGNVCDKYVGTPSVGVSPAFNVNLSSVLFSSVIPSESKSYKLTLLDGDLSVTVTGDIERDSNKITVPNSVTGTANRVSVLMTDKTWSESGAKIKYYGKLSDKGTFDLPSDYDKNWKVYIIAEQVNGEKETDYAGEPKKIEIPEEKEKEKEPTPLQEEQEPAPKQEDTKASEVLLAKLTDKGNRGLILTWTKVKGAEGYDIFFAKCGKNDKKAKFKKVRTVKGKVLTWTKKGLKKNTPYKARVKAWVKKGGKKTYILTSPAVHAYTSNGTKKYTNPKSVMIKKKTVTLTAGKNSKISAKVTPMKKGKTLIGKNHAPKLRYLSNNRKVATVSSSGKIKAKSKGSCKIFVYAVNGVWATISVKVQ